MDIAELIRIAKIGGERKDAQIDTCAPFAAALHDVLHENGIEASLRTARHQAGTTSSIWYHLVVEHEGVCYDSLGEFNAEILRKRLKYHPSTTFELTFTPERREGCYEEVDYDLLYEFLVKQFRAAARKLQPEDSSVSMKM